jgi:hypothetical protein
MYSQQSVSLLVSALTVRPVKKRIHDDQFALHLMGNNLNYLIENYSWRHFVFLRRCSYIYTAHVITSNSVFSC